MDTLGRYGADALGVASFLSEASRPGGIQAYLANRAVMGQDPAVRAYLQQHPNWSGAFGYGTTPPQLTVGGEGPALVGRQPNLPPLAIDTQAKQAASQIFMASFQRTQQYLQTGSGATAADFRNTGQAIPPELVAQEAGALGFGGGGGGGGAAPATGAGGTTLVHSQSYTPATGGVSYRVTERPPQFRSVSPDSTLMTQDPATGQWVPARVGGGGLRGPTPAAAGAGGGGTFPARPGYHVQSIRTDKMGRELPTLERDKPPTPIDEKTARSWASGVAGVDAATGNPLKATPEQRHAGKRILNQITREKGEQAKVTTANRQEANLSSLTSTTRTMIETAPSVQNLVKRIRRDMAHVQVGPFAGRWQELWARKIGADDPDFIKLRDEMDLLTTALQRMHVGARGGDRMFDHFQALLGTGQQSPANMEAALSVIDEYAQDKIAERTTALQGLRGASAPGPLGAGQGSPAPAAPGGLALPPGFTVQNVP